MTIDGTDPRACLADLRRWLCEAAEVVVLASEGTSAGAVMADQRLHDAAIAYGAAALAARGAL